MGATAREKIIVPPFQRGYEWEEKQIKALWRDLVDFQKSRKGSEKYFFGPIVIRYSTEGISLLDGQQRLASITILLRVLKDIASKIRSRAAEHFCHDTQQLISKGDAGYALELGRSDKKYFAAAIQSELECTMEPEIRTHLNIRNAKDILTELVSAYVGGAADDGKLVLLTNVKQVIQSDLAMAAITVEEEKDAYRIFETLNDRGMSLAAPDLLLNHLMWKANTDKEREVVKAAWDNIITTLESEKFETFLRAMWVSKNGDVKQGTFEAITS